MEGVSRDIRVAFYSAVVRDMRDNGASMEEILAELERISGHPVHHEDGNITIQIEE